MAQDQKQNMIIEAAIKRFAHFGVAKTTMNELARDLSISKALLYYYFPDKISLYAAVVEHITGANATNIDTVIDGADPFAAIDAFLESRTEFIIKYHHILEFLKQFTPATIPDVLQKVFNELRKRDLHRLTKIIEGGKEQGILLVESSRKSAELYFEFLESYRFVFISNHVNIFPGKKEFQALLKKEKEFSSVFFKGLTVSQE
jgi:TetR/AcrR family transcriptional repressor of mexJK operon